MSSFIPIDSIRRYPNLDWNRVNLSRNPTLTIDDISDPDREWDWKWISYSMSIEQVWKNPHLPWNKNSLSSNSTLTIDDVLHLSLPNAIGDWNWYWISYCVATIEQVRKNPHLPWDKEGLSSNPTLTIDDVLHLSLPNAIGDWNWDDIYLSIPVINVYIHPNIVWNRDKLSRNKDIRISDLIAWHEISPCIYSRWNYPSDVTIV
jgi:hypothetical protein